MLDVFGSHEDYWNRKPMPLPLVSFQLGDSLISRQFMAARNLLTKQRHITPELIVVDEFMADYERMWRDAQSTGQNGIWTAAPFTGIAWMEAMLGCEIYGNSSSFITVPCVSTIDELDAISLQLGNSWFEKYMEFTKKLVRLSAGRFPVGQPIMRGPSDIVGALIGQSNMILLMNDYPDQMRIIYHRMANIFRGLIRLQQEEIPAFHSGYSFGFYHLWAPGKCIWFQEDLTALFSPDYYRRFLKKTDEMICQDHAFTLVHLHPSSFFILDDLLEIERLRAIEVNKDIGGPTVREMLPIMAKIQKKKDLVVWGELSEEEIDTVLDGLPNRCIHFSILTPTVERAKRIMDHIYAKS